MRFHGRRKSGLRFAIVAGLAATVFATGLGEAVAAAGDCGQPGSSGPGPTAADALATLKRAVGTPSSCDVKPCVCDVSGDGTVTGSDALRVLRRAVGQPVELQCDCPCIGDPSCNDAPEDDDEEVTLNANLVAEGGPLPILLLENAVDPDEDLVAILSLDDVTTDWSISEGELSMQTDGFFGQLDWTGNEGGGIPLFFAIDPETGSADFTFSFSEFWLGMQGLDQVSLALHYTVTDGFATNGSVLTLTVQGVSDPPEVVGSVFFSYTTDELGDGAVLLEAGALLESVFDPDFGDQVAFDEIGSVAIDEQPAVGSLTTEAIGDLTFRILDGTTEVAVLTFGLDASFTMASSDDAYWSALGEGEKVVLAVNYRVKDKTDLYDVGRAWIEIRAGGDGDTEFKGPSRGSRALPHTA